LLNLGIPTVPGLRVGLLGGSFDPPHEGHVHITKWALRAFDLDRVWWLVTPGNPLKADGPADLTRRMAACRAVMTHPRVSVTAAERALGTRYTADTLLALRRRYPRLRFVWLMGADNLVSLHRWERWRWIVGTMPIGVLARPGEQLRGCFAPAARRHAGDRLVGPASRKLALSTPPKWALLTGRMSAQSSSALRAAGQWP
jgi:nicotinate-nucleotide adenylyltransferase